MNELDPIRTGESAQSPQATQSEAILRLLDRPMTSAELDARAELVSQPVQLGSGASVRLLLFRVGEEVAALPARQLRRATPLARPTPVPHRSGGVLRGVCNIRGELVLCADLHRLLGLPARREGAPGDGAVDTRRMVVVGPQDNSWAFEVDALMGVENADPTRFRAPPVTVEYALGDFTQAVTDIGGRSVAVLDGDRILAGFKAGLA